MSGESRREAPIPSPWEVAKSIVEWIKERSEDQSAKILEGLLAEIPGKTDRQLHRLIEVTRDFGNSRSEHNRAYREALLDEARGREGYSYPIPDK